MCESKGIKVKQIPVLHMQKYSSGCLISGQTLYRYYLKSNQTTRFLQKSSICKLLVNIMSTISLQLIWSFLVQVSEIVGNFLSGAPLLMCWGYGNMYQEAMTSLKQILDAMHRPRRVRGSARKLCNPHSLKEPLLCNTGPAAGFLLCRAL